MQIFVVALLILFFSAHGVTAQEATLDIYDGSDDFPLILVVHNQNPAMISGMILWKMIGCGQYDDMTKSTVPILWLPIMTEVTADDLISSPYFTEADGNDKFLIGLYWLRSDDSAVANLCSISS